MAASLWSHFVLPENAEGHVKGKCKHCATTISGHTKTTSNFITHLKRKHRDIYLGMKQEPSTSSSDSQQPSMRDYTRVTKSVKYDKRDHRQIQITDALISFIAGDLLPLAIVKIPHFKNLLEICEPRYQMPSRKHLSTKLLTEKSTETLNDIKHQLSLAQSVCLTIDLWSNRQMSAYIGITGHFILDWTLKSVMITCKKFNGRHTAEKIWECYEETVECLNISNKICSIITDNASNMKKAFKIELPGFDDHNQSASVDDDDDVDDDVDDDDDDDDNIASENITSDSDNYFDNLPRHIGCYAHTLQLVVRDGLKEAGQHLKNVISKASSIVSHVRKSIHASEILKDEKRLQAQNATRWNSQLYMIQSILNVSEEKLNSIDFHIKLSTYERKILQELCEILEPFENATNLIQGQNDVIGSLSIPVTIGIRVKLQELYKTFNNRMVTALKDSVEKRLAPYENDDALVMAAALDPRFKLRWCSPDKLSKTERTVESILNSYTPMDVSDIDSACKNPSDDSSSPQKKRSRFDFFDFMAPEKQRKRNCSGVKNELEDYLSSPCIDMNADPIKFWKNSNEYPSLKPLANKYLAIPASSAPVERIFSIAGRIFRPDRCSLKPETFEQLMLIKCNSSVGLKM